MVGHFSTLADFSRPESLEVCACIGHRPHHLPWGYNTIDERYLSLKIKMRRILRELIGRYHTKHFISGMSLGVDTYAARLVLEEKKRRGVTLECALFSASQDSGWFDSFREEYFSILSQADDVVLPSIDCTSECVYTRNRYMVDECDILFAVWNGEPGWTDHAVSYAKSQGVPVIVLHPETLRMSYIDGRGNV